MGDERDKPVKLMRMSDEIQSLFDDAIATVRGESNVGSVIVATLQYLFHLSRAVVPFDEEHSQLFREWVAADAALTLRANVLRDLAAAKKAVGSEAPDE